MGVKPVIAVQATKLLGFPVDRGGFSIPYFASNGRRIDFFRIRLDDPRGFAAAKDVKHPKYLQRQGSGAHAYFPPGWDANVKKCGYILICEGEAKAACAVSHGLPAIGIGGASMGRGGRQGTELLPAIEKAIAEHSDATIDPAYDSDVATNPEVARQRAALVRALIRLGRAVRIVDLPSADNGDKQGVDDFIVAHGKAAFVKLVEEAREPEAQGLFDQLSAEYAYNRATSEVLCLPDRPTDPIGSLSVPSFYDRTANLTYTDYDGTGQPKKRHAGKDWFASPRRRDVSGTTYQPGAPLFTKDNRANLWRPSGVVPVPGDVTPFLDLAARLVPDREHREWSFSWLAYPLQNPGAKLATAVLLHSRVQGVGKSMFCQTVAAAYGLHNVRVIDPKALGGQFNEFVANCQFVIGEEASPQRDLPAARAAMDWLKTLITESNTRVNRKYREAELVRNYSNFVFLTNNEDALALTSNDRRVAVFSTDAPKASPEFFRRYKAWEQDGGVAAALHWLLARNLAAFDPHAAAPWTQAKADMVEASRTQVEAFAHQLREAPDSVRPKGGAFLKVLSLHTAEELLSIFGNDRFSPKAMTQALREAGFRQTVRQQTRIDKETQVRLWAIRDTDRVAELSEREVKGLYLRERQANAPLYSRPTAKFPVLAGGKR